MKVGLSYSRCIADIIDGKVDINDVLVVISRTDFDPRNDFQWKSIYEGYTFGGISDAEWAKYDVSDEIRLREVTVELYNSGKLHQPRQFGAHPSHRKEHWLEVILPDSELERNTAAKNAWDQFKMIAGLTDIKINTSCQ
jgi:hypothetical protein